MIPSRYRKYVYGILVAAAPLLVFYGLMTTQEVALWLGVGSAAVGNGLAFANTASGKGR